MSYEYYSEEEKALIRQKMRQAIADAKAAAKRRDIKLHPRVAELQAIALDTATKAGLFEPGSRRDVCSRCGGWISMGHARGSECRAADGATEPKQPSPDAQKVEDVRADH